MIFIKKQRGSNGLGHESINWFLIGLGMEFEDASSEINSLGYGRHGLNRGAGHEGLARNPPPEMVPPPLPGTKNQ